MIHMQCMDEKVTTKLANNTMQFKDMPGAVQRGDDGYGCSYSPITGKIFSSQISRIHSSQT